MTLANTDDPTDDWATEMLCILRKPDMFERLVDALPHPLAIEGLRHWGAVRGLYPLERLEKPVTPEQS
jgi:hypothetical protein